MNQFLEWSIDYASEKAYLDDLFKIYPTIPNAIRDIDKCVWSNVEKAYLNHDDIALINHLLKLELFPIKDSYVAYLKRDNSAILRNPKTIRRIASEIYDMGLKDVYEKCSQPKETNRQIGPMFKNWIRKETLGFDVLGIDDFSSSNEDAILDATDKEMEDFARNNLGYKHDKGLDFLARISGKYIIGEAKFLSDFGGHQNAQFNDAISTISAKVKRDVIKIAILDGNLYVRGNKMYREITTTYKDCNIMSALMLRTFLYTI